MKKKILCTMMSMVMVASLFAGCGTDSGKENSVNCPLCQGHFELV